METFRPSRPFPPRMGSPDWNKVAPNLRDAILGAHADGRYPINLFGSPGNGKTSVAALMYSGWERGREPLWIDTSRFLNAAMQARRGELIGSTRERWGVWWHERDRARAAMLTVSEQDVLMRAERSGLVVLDDIGIRQPSEAKRELLLELVNLRTGAPLIVTGNLEPTELVTTFDERTASRLLSGQPVEVTGDDRRIEGSTIIRA